MSTPNFLQVKYQGVNIPSQTTSVAATAGDIAYNSTVNKWDVWNTAADFLVTENTTQTLYNKTLDATTTNASKFTNGSGVFILNTTGTITVPNGTDTLAGISLTQTLINKTIAAGSNTITGLTNTNLSGSAAITNANLASMPTLTIKGNNTGGSATPSDLTVAQVNAILPVFTTSLNGLAPSSGGGTTNYLRADGTWSAPPGTTGTVTSVSVVSANGFAGTVATSTTTPAITLTTTVTGILQGNGTAISGLSTTGSGNVVLAGTPTITNLNAGSTQITNVTDPTSAQQAATKNYVDTVASGLQPLQAVYAATTGSNLPGTYLNGTAGVGATFTTTSTTSPFTLDGTTPPLNSRIFIKDQTSGFQNGVYNFTTAPVGGVSGAVFTRAADYNTASDMNAGNLIPIINGTVNAPSGNPTIWIQTATITTVGTDNLVFVKFNSGGSGTVTSVALTAPSIFSVGGSPVTTSGTLALTYSGTALPIANGGTNATSAATAFSNLSPLTTAGDIIIENATPAPARLPVGTQGQVLTVASSGLPAWQTNPITTFMPVVAQYGLTTNQSVTAATPIKFDTKIVDTNNAYSTSTGQFTAPVSGFYVISDVLNSGITDYQIYKNGTAQQYTNDVGSNSIIASGATGIQLNAGDTLDIRPSTTITVDGRAAPNFLSSICITQVSGGSATGAVAAAASGSYTTVSTIVVMPTKTFDTSNAYSTSTGLFTAPVSGVYEVQAFLDTNSNGAVIAAYVNGSYRANMGITSPSANGYGTGTALVQVNAGDTIGVNVQSATANASTAQNISFTLISGSSTQASVAARYYNTASTISSSFSAITYSTKDYDTNSAYSAGTYTVPVAGKYQVCASVLVTGNGSQEIHQMGIFQNGTQKNESWYSGGGSATDLPQNVSDILNCSVGDTITVQVKSPTTTTITSSNFGNFFSIARLGN